MGQRTSTETLAQVMLCLLERRTVRQADLVAHLNVGIKAVRRCLVDLSAAGVPLVRDDTKKPDVYWSVPKTWFPGAVVFSNQELKQIVRYIARLPASLERDQLLAKILASGQPIATNAVSAETTEHILATAEDSRANRAPLRIGYYSASRAEESTRTVSVQEIVHKAPARLLAVCHRTDTLKWFRLSNINSAVPSSEGFRSADADSIARVLAESVNGYHVDAPAVTSSFEVRGPEHHWVSRNLPAGKFTVEPLDQGIRVSITTSAVLPLARFVVGLGAAATGCSEELRAEVARLATAALRGSRPPRLAKGKPGTRQSRLAKGGASRATLVSKKRSRA